MQQKLKLTRAWETEREQSIDDSNLLDKLITEEECSIETQEWEPINTEKHEIFTYAIIDGTEKTHRSFTTMIDNIDCFTILGSIAVGAVEINPDQAMILENQKVPILRRFRIQFMPDHQKNPVDDLKMHIGNHEFKFEGTRHQLSNKEANLNSVHNLMDNLTALMGKEELKLANELSASYKIVFLDGPVTKPNSTKKNIVGYIKGMRQIYIPKTKQAILEKLKQGQRTPIFRIPGKFGDKLSWFVCLKKFDSRFYDYKAGLMRFEVAEESNSIDAIEKTIGFANFTSMIFPELAPESFKDSRAPHNPVPVGELEKRIKHLIGNKLIIDRGILNYIYNEQ
jgi:hypothetical protein